METVPAGSHQLKVLLLGAFWIISVGFEGWILEGFPRVIGIIDQGYRPPPTGMQRENKTIITSKERKTLHMEISHIELGTE